MATETIETNERPDWRAIGVQLAEAFDPKDVDFRAQGRASEQTGKAQVVAYIDARAVQDRLDAVVGVGNWSFDWTPIVTDKGEVMVAKGTITIHGVSKSDAGSASNFEQSLGAVSHCFKRAAVQWGVGRYLYGLPMSWVAVEKNGRIPDATLRELRSRLPRPGTHAAAPSASRAHAATAPSDAPADATTEAAPATAPASLKVSDMDAHLATVASEKEQRALVTAIKAKGFTSIPQVSGFVAAQITRDLDIAALGKATSDITRAEVRTLEDALKAIRAPRPLAAQPTHA